MEASSSYADNMGKCLISLLIGILSKKRLLSSTHRVVLTHNSKYVSTRLLLHTIPIPPCPIPVAALLLLFFRDPLTDESERAPGKRNSLSKKVFWLEKEYSGATRIRVHSSTILN